MINYNGLSDFEINKRVARGQKANLSESQKHAKIIPSLISG